MGREERKGGILKEHVEAFGVDGYMFDILIVVMVSLMHTYVRLIQLYVLKV